MSELASLFFISFCLFMIWGKIDTIGDTLRRIAIALERKQ